MEINEKQARFLKDRILAIGDNANRLRAMIDELQIDGPGINDAGKAVSAIQGAAMSVSNALAIGEIPEA
jgi:hypothetical protein